MFHMLTCFNLKPGVSIEEFSQSMDLFDTHMKEKGLSLSMGPIGERQSDTIMDTDDERDHQFFFISTFEDRAQCDLAVDYILKHEEPGDSIHTVMYAKIQNPVFICWQDL